MDGHFGCVPRRHSRRRLYRRRRTVGALLPGRPGRSRIRQLLAAVAAHTTGEISVADHEPHPGGRRFRAPRYSMGLRRASRQQHPGPGARRGAGGNLARSEISIVELSVRQGRGAYVESVAQLCHRRAQHEVRLSGRVQPRYRAAVHHHQQLHAHGLSLPERRAQSDYDGRRRVHAASPDGVGGFLRPGAVDAGAADAAGRAPVRSRLELLPRAGHRPVALLPDGNRDPPHQGDSRLQRHHAARGRGVRSVRKLEDVAQGELRRVPVSGEQRRPFCRREPRRPDRHADDPLVERSQQPRRQRRLRAAVQSHEPGGQRRVRTVDRPGVRGHQADHVARSVAVEGLGRPSERLAVRARDPAGGAAAGVGGGQLQPPLVEPLPRCDRQRPDGDRRLRPVFGDRAGRFAAAEWRRLPGRAVVRHQAGAGRAGAEPDPHHRELRGLRSALGRRGCLRRGQARGGADAAGWHEYGATRREHLRHPPEPARVQRQRRQSRPRRSATTKSRCSLSSRGSPAT